MALTSQHKHLSTPNCQVLFLHQLLRQFASIGDFLDVSSSSDTHLPYAFSSTPGRVFFIGHPPPNICLFTPTPSDAFSPTPLLCVLTRDGTEQPERARRWPGRVVIDHAFARGLRQRDGQADGLVELAPAGLHRHDGGHGHAVAEQLGGQLGVDGLGLERGAGNLKFGTEGEWRGT